MPFYGERVLKSHQFPVPSFTFFLTIVLGGNIAFYSSLLAYSLMFELLFCGQFEVAIVMFLALLKYDWVVWIDVIGMSLS